MCFVWSSFIKHYYKNYQSFGEYFKINVIKKQNQWEF